MARLNKDRIVENLLVAQAMVMDLPRNKFIPELACFTNVTFDVEGPHACGSAACFGGWVAVHPHFIAQGIGVAPTGAPQIEGSSWVSDVAEYLFGDGMLFAAKHTWEKGSAKQAVLVRIEKALEKVLR